MDTMDKSVTAAMIADGLNLSVDEWNDLEHRLLVNISKVIDDKVAAERERCVGIVQSYHESNDEGDKIAVYKNELLAQIISEIRGAN